MIHYFDASRLTAVDSICFHLNILLKKYVLPGQPVIVMCIGSDRSTGDSLGPLVGYKLSKFTFENVHVYGCLQSPIHAANLSAAIDKIRRQHSLPFYHRLRCISWQKRTHRFYHHRDRSFKTGTWGKKKAARSRRYPYYRHCKQFRRYRSCPASDNPFIHDYDTGRYDYCCAGSDISYKCFSRYTASACATVAAPPDIITCFNSVSFSTVTYSFPRYAS